MEIRLRFQVEDRVLEKVSFQVNLTEKKMIKEKEVIHHDFKVNYCSC